MEDWEKALYQFLEEWKHLDNFEGALVTGSQVFGTATPKSDVDVHIVLSQNTDWRERGNKIIDGYLIEYFANPTLFFKQYLDEDLANNGRQNARMFTKGRTLIDKTGEVATLVTQACEYMIKPFKKPDASWAEIAKYSIWDELDGLDDLYNAKAPSFRFSCHLFLRNLLAKYAKFIGAEVPNYTKLYKYLSSKEFRVKYDIQAFPDSAFSGQLLRALESANDEEIMATARSLATETLKKMGGFNIDGWTLRTSVTGGIRRIGS